jgi:hypothetical protein
MLPAYENCEAIKEILIVNNAADKTPELNFSKVTLLNQDRNIYVNASWNLGASLAKHTVILANDDIIISDIDQLLWGIRQSSHELIGASINNYRFKGKPFAEGECVVDAGKYFSRNNFGCFMVSRKYHPIPENLRICFGDDYLFRMAKSRGLINSKYIKSHVGATIALNPEFNEIIKMDTINYQSMYHA